MNGQRDASEVPLPVYDSAARAAPFIEEGQALLRYRDLIVQLVARSVKARYKRSILGVAWTMVNPLLTMTVLTLVFTQLFRAPARDYALDVLPGLLAWNFYAQSTTAAMSDLLWGGRDYPRLPAQSAIRLFSGGEVLERQGPLGTRGS